jgi:hypothetical protein
MKIMEIKPMRLFGLHEREVGKLRWQVQHASLLAFREKVLSGLKKANAARAAKKKEMGK